MIFSSLIFLCVFMPIFFALYFIVQDRFARNIILLIFSLIFYAWGEPAYVLLMILSIFVNYILALRMQKYKDVIEKKSVNHRYAEVKHARKSVKRVFIAAIVFNLGLLGVFKYTNFLFQNLNVIFGLDFEMVNIALPVGISFYTFQILSYVIDVYYGRVEVQKNIINLGTYVAAFPQLIAGPIVRYKDIDEALENRQETMALTTEGIRYFIIGLSKKTLIANTCAEIIKIIMQYSNVQYKMMGALLIAIAYTFQIYFDFSGYSDMAIGLGKMLGFNYDINFNYPYIARSVTDFWKRWHISLSTFFRDYVYIPLGGNRVSVTRHIINLLIVWFLTGMWHGASWNFIIWGLYYGVLLIIEKYTPEKIKKLVPRFLGHIITLIIIIFGWIIFRIENMNEFSEFMKTLFGSYGVGNYKFFENIGLVSPQYVIAMIMAFILSTPILNMIYVKFRDNKVCHYIFDFILILMFLLSAIFIAVGTYNPFIYFKF